jgi:hypothetical protein
MDPGAIITSGGEGSGYCAVLCRDRCSRPRSARVLLYLSYHALSAVVRPNAID